MAVLVLDQDADRTADDVVQNIRLVACVYNDALVWILAAVAVFKESPNTGIYSARQ